jgi:alanine dehydrogenase
MHIGVPIETKPHEYRVGLTPDNAGKLCKHGHSVYIESGLGINIGFSNPDYRSVGAIVLDTAEEVFSASELIIKVKEPQPGEFKFLTDKHILFTFLHLAPNIELTEALLASNCIAIAYETVTDSNGRFPLLAPMSEIAGRMSIQAGAHCLEMQQGGRGILLGGAMGIGVGKVLILGGGVVGTYAADVAIGMGADVTVLDKNDVRLQQLHELFKGNIQISPSNSSTIQENLHNADLVIGAAMSAGAKAPVLVNREMLSNMKKGSVLVDVAIDQGGCFETSIPTTHKEPTFVREGIIHYCVSNIPGVVARTSTLALNKVTLPYIIQLADKGFKRALSENSFFSSGVNVYRGQLCCAAVAQDQAIPYMRIDDLLTRPNE